MNTDYAISILAEQRRQDLTAEAANDRLAKIATADRTPWWSRLAAAVRPQPALTARHRVAH